MIRASSRLARRSTADLRAIRAATARIEELTSILDLQLDADSRPEQQMRHLRQATGQITRSANDGIQAYRRVSQALAAEKSHPDADRAETERTRRELSRARSRMLNALALASKRYPWAKPWQPVSNP
ncbi:MAG TPA: hypothetical protein VFN76_11205 [Candidatus Limnocylindria bacterium]|nr:hypothetical protein [Candidatus Limnocylindria bacterium]